MKKIVLLFIFFLVVSVYNYSQNESVIRYQYEFKLEQVTVPGDAKTANDAFIRNLFSSVAFFNDETDLFSIITPTLISGEAFEMKAVSAGYTLISFNQTTIE